jgi:hypothetical protein
MRVLLAVVVVLGVSGNAIAQPVPRDRQPPDTADTTIIAGSSGCWPTTSRDRVVVHLDDGPARQGTLLCMGPEQIMVTGSGMLSLDRIQKIEKPRDSEIDGLLKGAAVGLVILLFCVNDCEAEYVLRATLGYAAIGATLDALQGNNKTIYRREPRTAVGFKLRF